jgi:AcrR family transcriptional regulator
VAEPDGRHPSRPTPKSAETRARIVRGALRALEHYGLAETTTRRIATEAEVRLATLHYHFESKEAVLLAVLDVLVLEMTVKLGDKTSPLDTLDTRIADVLRAAWAYVEQTRAKQIVQYELTLYALRTRDSEWLAARQYQAYVDAYATVLRSGFAAEPTEGQAQELARLMLAGMDGLILQGLAGAGPHQLAAGLDALIAATQARAQVLAQRK